MDILARTVVTPKVKGKTSEENKSPEASSSMYSGSPLAASRPVVVGGKSVGLSAQPSREKEIISSKAKSKRETFKPLPILAASILIAAGIFGIARIEALLTRQRARADVAHKKAAVAVGASAASGGDEPDMVAMSDKSTVNSVFAKSRKTL
eukprot:GHVT01001767.1.p1 GENE.GHVT01001767.1~~GHVT01001767.1.p1  ORF type:complete len:151 (+),score=31.89 GHVT01001767.1:624-1076(+)